MFDLKDSRINPLDKKYSQKYIDVKKEFIDEVVYIDLMIYKFSNKIIAEAKGMSHK